MFSRHQKIVYTNPGMGRESGHFRTVFPARPDCQIIEARGLSVKTFLAYCPRNQSLSTSPQILFLNSK